MKGQQDYDVEEMSYWCLWYSWWWEVRSVGRGNFNLLMALRQAMCRLSQSSFYMTETYIL